MIMKKTFYASGNQVQETAANLNRQVSNYLIETGLFSLFSTQEGNGSYPKYMLRYKESDYLLQLQSENSDSPFERNLQMEILHGIRDEKAAQRLIYYGSVKNATLTLHLLAHRDSMAFKIIDANSNVAFGGSCIRYTEYSGKEGYLYNAKEAKSLLGYMGRYEIEPGKVAQLMYNDYSSQGGATVKKHPIIGYKDVAIGYANDLVVINGSHLSGHDEFSSFILDDAHYHGGPITYSDFFLEVSQYAAAAMKNE